MKKQELGGKLLKFCPGCKRYFPKVWKECPSCKKALKNIFFNYYIAGPFKKVFLPFILILLCVYGTYGIQVNERLEYSKGASLILKGKFAAGWDKIRGALVENPLYKYGKPLAGRIKNRVKETGNKQYTLRDIYFDASSGINSALINNRIVFEGDDLGDFKVIKINSGSIDIEAGGEQRNIKFASSWTSK